jgi:hypothetical protein
MNNLIYIIVVLILYKILFGRSKAEFVDITENDRVIMAQTTEIINRIIIQGLTISGNVNLNGINIRAGNMSAANLNVNYPVSVGRVFGSWFESNGKIEGRNIINAGSKIKQSGEDLLPSGIIMMWYGSTVNIPTGWVLCNGQNGTPDLRDKFVSYYWVNNIYTKGSDIPQVISNYRMIGGSMTHSHGSSEEMRALIGHGYSRFSVLGGVLGYTPLRNFIKQYKVGTLPTTGDYRQMIQQPYYNEDSNINPDDGYMPATAIVGNTDEASNIPEYVALCYIMKV